MKLRGSDSTYTYDDSSRHGVLGRSMIDSPSLDCCIFLGQPAPPRMPSVCQGAVLQQPLRISHFYRACPTHRLF